MKNKAAPAIDRKYWYWGGALLALIAVAVLVWSYLPPAQLGADEEVHKTVDALFTAITTKDPERLRDCEQRIASFQREGRLPKNAASFLNTIIQKAHGNQWDSAAHQLYDFMYLQHR